VVGLSLIGLTIAIHAIGVVMMALVGARIRVRLETRSLGLWLVVPIVIGVVGAVGLLLAALHGVEAAIWAAAYLWLGALDAPMDAMLYSVDSMTTRGASGADAATTLADDGRAGGGRRYASVRYQHGLHVCGAIITVSTKIALAKRKFSRVRMRAASVTVGHEHRPVRLHHYREL
jgi:hypothetical protein